MHNTQRPYLFLRALRQVDHTVFCVENGQKTYRDPMTGRQLPYSSGQQVKRSILEHFTSLLGEPYAPVTFNWTLTKDKKDQSKFSLEQGEPWSPCDPIFADQLIGGWMRAQSGGSTVKRRSPLSISAMHPLHPSLANTSTESVTFDRSNHPDQHILRTVNEKGEEIPAQELARLLLENNRNLPMRIWIPADKVGGRATGLFVYDIAIDLRTLFTVSMNIAEPELSEETRKKVEDAGWQKSPDGLRFICPEPRRNQLILALANSLIHWQITSNQSRTYSPQPTLAVALCDNVNRLSAAIRADLKDDDNQYRNAVPVLERIQGVSLHTALTAKAYVPGVEATVDALEDAEAEIVSILNNYNYDL